MPRVVHFEIHADDPERAVRFYSEVFAWHFQKLGYGDQPYWLIATGDEKQPGINGGLVPRQGPRPQLGQAVNAYTCTIEVPSVDQYLHTVQQHGCKVALPKMAIPGVGWLAYFIDTEGNIVGMHQADPTAK